MLRPRPLPQEVYMKTRIAFSLTLVLMFAGNDSAQSSRGSRRSTTRVSTSRLTDFSNFVGIWEYSGDSLGKSYLKVTEEQPGRFKFMQGFEYQGNITWVATMINGADG